MRKGCTISAAALLLLLGGAKVTAEELSLEIATDIHVDETNNVDEMPQLKIVTDERQLQVEDNPVFDFKYEYQMDVNPAGSTPTIDLGMNELQTEIKDSLDEFIAQASTPPLNIQAITSQQLGTPCTPTIEGYDCAIVESTVTVEILNALGGDVVEKATIERVQMFVDRFNNDNQGSLFVTFIGPFFVSTELVLEISPVMDEMDDTEIALVEGVLFDILEPALANDPPPSIALETVEFLYQDLLPIARRGRGLQGQRAFRNNAHFYVTGQCRGCSSGDMAKKVDDAVDANADRIRETLQEEGPENGTEYFDGVGPVGVAAPLSNTGSAGAINPASAPQVNTDNNPYWVWVILGTAIGLLVLGFVLMFYKKRRDRIAVDGKAHYEGGDDVINSNVVVGMQPYDTPNDPAPTRNVYPADGQMYQDEEAAETMPPVTPYEEEEGISDAEDGSYVCEADEIEEVYLPSQEHPPDHFRHPQPLGMDD